MAADLTDIHKALLKKAKDSKETGKDRPEDYVNRIADLDDPHEVLRVLSARARSAGEFRQPFEEEWQEAFRAWMQILDPEKKEDKWRSKRFIPMLFQHIESAHPSIASAVFSGTKIIEYVGKAPDMRDRADAMTALVDSHMRGNSRMKRAYLRALWWSIVTGTGIMDHGWAKESLNRMVAVLKDDFDGAGRFLREDGSVIEEGDTSTPRRQIKTMERKLVDVTDHPFIKSVTPFDAWACEHGEAGIEHEWDFLRHETSMRKILNALDAGNTHLDRDAVFAWFEAVKGKSAELRFSDGADGDIGLDMEMYSELLEEVGYSSDNDATDDDKHTTGDSKVVLLVYRSQSELFTIAPGGRIIGWSDNPNAHGKNGLLWHHMWEIPDCPYGRGIGTVLLPHQELVNENINRAMDVDEITLMAPIGVDRTRVSVLDDKWRWQPNAMVRTRGDPKTAVTRLDMPTPTNLAMNWDMHFKKDADDTTGMTEQARGITPAGINTATEFTGLQANIKTRTFMLVERLNETLEQSGYLLKELIQQYTTKEQIISAIGEDGLYYRTVKPQELVGDFDIRAHVSSSRMAPAMKVQQLIAATQVIVPIIQQVPNSPFLSRWVRMLLKEMGVEDVDRLIPKNQEKVRDPYMENIALRKGIKIVPSPYERHDLHIEAHVEEIMKLQEMMAAGQDVGLEIDALMEHNNLHMQIGGQMGMAMAGGSPPPPTPPGGSPERADAQAMGAAQGSNGIPGKSSPGPQAPAGRPK